MPVSILEEAAGAVCKPWPLNQSAVCKPWPLNQSKIDEKCHISANLLRMTSLGIVLETLVHCIMRTY